MIYFHKFKFIGHTSNFSFAFFWHKVTFFFFNLFVKQETQPSSSYTDTMNKIKNVFQRSQKTVEERRPYQFIKRHSSVAARPSLIEITSEQPNASPAIELFDLSEIERPSYQAWWKDLDPFGHGKISNQAVLKFLSGCTLEDNKLEQVKNINNKNFVRFLLLKCIHI